MRHLAPVLLTFAATLAAQGSRGPLLGLPHGFSIDQATVLPSTSPGDLRLADSGIDGVLPPPRPPSAVIPDFSTYLGGALVDVDALSLGYDWIVSTPAGDAVVPPTQWAALTYSVSRATGGRPGTVVADEANGNGAAADVFAYVIPGSNAPFVVVGVPFRSQDSVEAAGFGPAVPNIDAHDLYVSLIYQENPRIAAMLPPPTVYFSVTDATKGNLPASWITAPGAASGATVFQTTWVPATLSWTQPVVAYTAADFGLGNGEDLDALALDLAHGLVLFSTDPLLPPMGGPRDPVLFSVLGSGVLTDYHLPGGPSIAHELGLGLGPDDVDGICALDPGGVGQPSPILLDFLLGRPSPPLPTTLPTQLQASAWRREDLVTGLEYASTWMTGWPPPGTPQPSLAISAASLGGPSAPFIVLDVFVRPANPFQGDPHRTEIQIPPSFSLGGQQLNFLWGALSPTSFDISLPVAFRL
ncbi:MAG TPA: hypothetical protein VFZ65_16875 [Planctomycetota bacterium]|nr:hypothetical protein [Planctomycetota bacterium]